MSVALEEAPAVARLPRSPRPRRGREPAARIPSAGFQSLEGAEHFPWRGRSREVLRATLRGLGVPEEELEREPEVAADSASDREIADRLVLSPHSVLRHVADIRTKLRRPPAPPRRPKPPRLGLI